MDSIKYVVKFREGSWVRQTLEEGRKTYRPKRCGNNNKDEDNSPETLNDKNVYGFMYIPASDKFSFLFVGLYIKSWMAVDVV